MKEIKGSIEIDAPPDIVWLTVTDFSSYPKWNPWITNMAGELKVGSTYDATVSPPGKGAMRLKSTVIRIENGKEVLFKGKAMGGFLSDEHIFAIELISPEKTRFSQRVVFKGLLVPLVSGAINASQTGLEEMNLALKKMCEGKEES